MNILYCIILYTSGESEQKKKINHFIGLPCKKVEIIYVQRITNSQHCRFLTKLQIDCDDKFSHDKLVTRELNYVLLFIYLY